MKAPGVCTHANTLERCIACFTRQNAERVRQGTLPQVAARASSAATAGSTFPSQNSRKAPPPVEM